GQTGDQLQLTAAGQQTLETLTTAYHDSLAELLDGWSPEQEAELAALLRRVATDLFSEESSSSSDEQPAYARLRTLLSEGETRGRYLPENEGRCPLNTF